MLQSLLRPPVLFEDVIPAASYREISFLKSTALPPSAGSWHKAQRRGGLATGASWQAGRARCLRPPDAPPSPSPDGCHDCRVGPHRTDRCGNASGMVHRRARRTLPGGQPGDRCLYRPGRATYAAQRCGERGASWAGGVHMVTAVRHPLRCGEVLDVDNALRRVWHIFTRSEHGVRPWDKRLGPVV